MIMGMGYRGYLEDFRLQVVHFVSEGKGEETLCRINYFNRRITCSVRPETVTCKACLSALEEMRAEQNLDLFLVIARK